MNIDKKGDFCQNKNIYSKDEKNKNSNSKKIKFKTIVSCSEGKKENTLNLKNKDENHKIKFVTKNVSNVTNEKINIKDKIFVIKKDSSNENDNIKNSTALNKEAEINDYTLFNNKNNNCK